MSTPNIFHYATSELSQDAFICYLVACASEATGPLQKCGLAFVRTLFRAGASDGTKDIPVLDSAGERASYNEPCKVREVCTPKRQYHKIDVYFQARVDGKKVSFIIEDKVDTEAHGDQLREYLNAVIQDEHKKDLIKPIYFKTGYMFNNERDGVKKKKYSVFKAEDLKKFLDSHPQAIRESEILHQYSEYLNEKIEARAEALANWDLNQDYVQWEFMQKLRGVLRKADDEWQHFVPFPGEPDEWRWKGLGRGYNLNSKSPWTQYWYSENLFWRLDAWRPLRLMISFANAGKSYNEKQERYRIFFDKALKQEGLCAGNVRILRRGKERTIGSIATENLQEMTVREFLHRVTRVHIRFLKLISA